MLVRKKTVAAVVALVLGVGTLAGLAAGDERASVTAAVDALEHDAAHRDQTADLVKRARAALEQATRLRAVGDETHARLADGLAQELAGAAQDLARTIDDEAKAAVMRRGALDAGAHAERERALLEEGIARNGRLRAEIEALGRGHDAPLRTSSKGAKPGVDAGAAAPQGADDDATDSEPAGGGVPGKRPAPSAPPAPRNVRGGGAK